MVAEGVDIGTVVTEIEDLGESDLRRVQLFFQQLFEHLIEIDACSGHHEVTHWRAETHHLQGSALAALSPSMRQLLSVSKVWQDGQKAARGILADVGHGFGAPRDLPFNFEDMLSETSTLTPPWLRSPP